MKSTLKISNISPIITIENSSGGMIMTFSGRKDSFGRLHNNSPLLVKKDNQTILLRYCGDSKTESDLNNENFIVLQAASTIIQQAKQTVKLVQKEIQDLRKLTLQATQYNLTTSQRLKLEKQFDKRLKSIETYAKDARFYDLPLMCGQLGKAVELLAPNNANISNVKLKNTDLLDEGIYTLRLGVEVKEKGNYLSVSLFQDDNLIETKNTNLEYFSSEKAITISGLEVTFNDISVDDLLEAKIGSFNDAQILTANLISPLPPNNYKVLLMETAFGHDVYLGRFFSRLKKLKTDVGGMHLEFSKKLLSERLEDGKAFSEIVVDYKTLDSPIVVGTWILPLKIEFSLSHSNVEVELMPLVPEALIADAFGSLKSIADLSVAKGFDPSINLEVIEAINQKLINYDKTLTTYLEIIQRNFSLIKKESIIDNPDAVIDKLSKNLHFFPLKLLLKLPNKQL